VTNDEIILALGTKLGLTEPTNGMHVLDRVELLIEDHHRLRLQQAAIIRKAKGQHPNTLAAVASSFSRRAD
jgi:hypothetical protein